MEEINIEALMEVTYGLYIISSKEGDNINGFVGNTVMQTSAEPPTIAVCANQKHLTTEYIEKSGVFSISILPQDLPRKLLGTFGFQSGRDIDKFTDVEYELGETGAPILTEHNISYIEAEVIEEVEVETHKMFIGRIVNCGYMNKGKEPLTYDYYHNVLKGKSPESAPTYQGEKEGKETEKAVQQDELGPKYECEVCGYVYDPAEGDPDNGIEPGTPFAELPEDWVCPLCGVGKDKFFALTKEENAKEDDAEGDLGPKYECDVCGYIYDPAEGDPDNGIEPGTPFAELPEDWVCPLCGVGKDKFTKLDD